MSALPPEWNNAWDVSPRWRYDHRGDTSVRSVGGGASNGLSARRPFDRWYRYPAGFSPTSLDLSLRSVLRESDEVLVDPFAGAASVGTEAVRQGRRFVGLEAHPEIAELAGLKFERPGLADGLVAAAERAVEASTPQPTELEPELVRRCFSPSTLDALVGLREAVRQAADSPWHNYLKWALLGTLRDVAGVKVGWPYQRPALERTAPHRDAARRFVQRVQWMAADLAGAPSPSGSVIVAGDSRQSTTWRRALGEGKASACVTSPPYLNNFDYADATRLELYFWGSVRTWAEMCNEVRAGMLVATTQQTRKTAAFDAEARLEQFPQLAATLQPLLRKLEGERTRRTRGKEYDRVAAPYFIGIATVLSQLFDALEPGARCAWLVGDSAPYGIYLDTPGMIGILASDLGYELLADDVVRTRGQRWRTNGVRHKVELSERLITFQRP